MDFSSTSFNKELFQNLILPQADLSDKEFSGCTFKKCDFSDADFTRASFLDCAFINCNLSNIKVENSAFQGVIFDNCKLLGIRFSAMKTFLISWLFRNCKITLCDFSRLPMKNSNFFDCEIKETDFITADLVGADFTGSDLSGSKFNATHLEKANFIGAKNYYIDPTQNFIKKAKFSQPEVLSMLARFDIEIV